MNRNPQFSRILLPLSGLSKCCAVILRMQIKVGIWWSAGMPHTSCCLAFLAWPWLSTFTHVQNVKMVLYCDKNASRLGHAYTRTKYICMQHNATVQSSCPCCLHNATLPYYDLLILARTVLSQPCFMTLNSLHADMYSMEERKIGCNRGLAYTCPLLVLLYNSHWLITQWR